MKNLKEETKILLSRAYILSREDNYQHFDIIARMKECVDEIDRECEEEKGKKGETKMEIKEIRIRKLGDGYEYELYEDKKLSGGARGLTGFEAIKVVVAKIERWEEERKVHRNEIKDKIEQEQEIAHRITQTLQTLVEGEYATKEDIRRIMQEEIAKIGDKK